MYNNDDVAIAEAESMCLMAEAMLPTSEREALFAAPEVARVTPTTFEEAMQSPDAPQWAAAIAEEFAAHDRNGTWSLVERPDGVSPIRCRLLFKIKYGSRGELLRFKVRLVALGCAQRAGIDYKDTFAPVARLTTIRLVMAIACFFHMFVDQMDVKTAFLNGKLVEEIYMFLPQGMSRPPGYRDPVCRLHRGLYGLKQAPRAWNQNVHAFLLSLVLHRARVTRAFTPVKLRTVLCFSLSSMLMISCLPARVESFLMSSRPLCQSAML
jgi:hypothetical protein